MTAQPQTFTAQQYQDALDDYTQEYEKKRRPETDSVIRAALQQCAKGCGEGGLKDELVAYFEMIASGTNEPRDKILLAGVIDVIEEKFSNRTQKGE